MQLTPIITLLVEDMADINHAIQAYNLIGKDVYYTAPNDRRIPFTPLDHVHKAFGRIKANGFSVQDAELLSAYINDRARIFRKEHAESPTAWRDGVYSTCDLAVRLMSTFMENLSADLDNHVPDRQAHQTLLEAFA
jgi:hypothetical protein